MAGVRNDDERRVRQQRRRLLGALERRAQVVGAGDQQRRYVGQRPWRRKRLPLVGRPARAEVDLVGVEDGLVVERVETGLRQHVHVRARLREARLRVRVPVPRERLLGADGRRIERRAQEVRVRLAAALHQRRAPR